MEGENTMPLRLLSLDGGGVRGLSSLMILKDIMRGLNRGKSPENIQQPWQLFDLIGGTSTGGLLAVMLGRLRMSVEECEAAYLNLSERIFNPRRSSANVIGRAKDLWNTEGRFDADELKACIIDLLKGRMVDRETLLKDPDPTCKVFVCAVLTSNSRACVLRSYENEEMSELLYDSCKIWEACRATSAATTFFDPIEIGPYKQKFADGAIAYNNPIQLVYREAETLWPNRIREAILVSIGTGSAPSPALEGNLLSIVKVLKDIAVQTESTADDFFSDHIRMTNSDLLYRFNVYHGLAEIGLEEYKERRRIADATHAYLTAGETRQRWRRCVQKLGSEIETEITTPIANMSSPMTPVTTEPPLPPQQTISFTRPRVLVRKPISAPSIVSSTEIESMTSIEASVTSLPTLSPQSTNIPTPLSPVRTSLDDVQDFARQRRLNERLLEYISMADEVKVREALADGADIQAENNKPLTTAINSGAANIVQILLDEGAKVNALDGDKQTPISLAVSKGNFVITKTLTEHGAYLNVSNNSWTPLHDACYEGENALVKYLLQHGADMEAQTSPNLRTPLHSAAMNGKVEIIDILLDAGSNIEAESAQKRTPLWLACTVNTPGNYQSAKRLIERGAKLEAKRESKGGPNHEWMYDGDTVLHMTARRDLGKYVELLVDSGADVYARNQSGDTALDLAVYYGRSSAIGALPNSSRSTRTKRVTNEIGDIANFSRKGIGKLFFK